MPSAAPRPLPIARPGGRTARTRAAVFEAAAALIAARDPGQIAMTDIAARAGVAATSLYRRWGTVRALLMEVAVERLMQDSPLPDTGTLAEDLRVWARRVAGSLKSREGSAFFRIFIATAPSGDDDRLARAASLSPRLKQIYDMVERARLRGEAVPGVMDVTDYILAPLYVRALFGVPADESVADRLVAQAMRLAA